MKKYIRDLRVKENRRLNDTHHVLVLTGDRLPHMVPGQFVEARVAGSPETFLRRPLSVHDVDTEENTLSLLVKVVGSGTAALAGLEPGETLNLVFPLGQGFTLTEKQKVLLVGGGCGVAPLLFLARELAAGENEIHVLIGGKSSSDILLAEVYEKYGTVHVATEDGSQGEKGMVTHHSVLTSPTLDFGQIYCCGPDGMMRAVAHLAAKAGIPCEVSLENTMACGIGACLCCVVETQQGNQCVCTEGPVFNATRLKNWTAETEIGCQLDQKP